MPIEENEHPPHEPFEGEDPAEAPNEGSAGHHPDDDDVRDEDAESEQSFPASDPPANY
jgi:hypothetical protein